MKTEHLEVWQKHVFDTLAQGLTIEQICALPERTEEQRFLFFAYSQYLKTKKHEDAVLVFSGERSGGKSSTALELALLLRYFGMKFEMRNICYGKSDMADISRRLTEEEDTVFIFDEAIKNAHSRQAMTAENISLVQNTTANRKLNNILIFCIPAFLRLDKGVLDDIVHHVIVMYAKTTPQEYNDIRFSMVLLRKNKSQRAKNRWMSDKAREYKYSKPVFTTQEMRNELHTFFYAVCDMRAPMVPKFIYDYYETRSKLALKTSGIPGMKTPKTVQEIKQQQEPMKEGAL